MKLASITFLAVLLTVNTYAQVEEVVVEEEVEVVEESENLPDTTRMNIGKKEIIIIDKDFEENEFDGEFDEDEKKHKKDKAEAHWAGLDFGFTMLMNQSFENKFSDEYAYFRNDAARSQVWNLNILEHKFRIAKEYVGLTTGLGFSFTSVAFNDNYVLRSTADTVFAEIDSVYTYSKNKLKATYLTMPLMLEFNTNADADKSFYLAAGVVGGVRIASKVKRKGEFDGKEFTTKDKGTYGLNSFKVDAAVRLGYGDWGVFANYSLLPLFDKGKTVETYPLTFGLSLNF